MKLLFFAICTLFFTTSLLAQNVNIPDAIFKEYLVSNTAINTNGDGEISVAEATACEGWIFVSNKGIADLTGIEAFIKITRLDCSQNNLTTLDLSNNNNLTHIDCYDNKLSTLDISNNAVLTSLVCYNNSLTTIKGNNSRALIILFCYNNLLNTLDVSMNTALKNLVCSNNKLTSLVVSNNIDLIQLVCGANNLTTIDVTQNKKLTELGCYANKVTALDLTNNPDLKYLSCHDNNLTSLDVSASAALTQILCMSNKLTNLDVSINTDLTILWCGGNNLTSLDVSRNKSLIQLLCPVNNLSSIDVSNNIALITLYCSINNLSTLDISNNEVLTNLNCDENNLSSLDIDNNKKLTELRCSDNNLTSLNVTKNIELTFIDCGENQITTLDVSKNTALTKLVCNNNNLNTLDVRNGENTALTTFDAPHNPNLYCISVNDVAWATENWKNIDSTTTFNTNCSENYLQAIFKADTLFGEIPLRVQFTDQSSGKPDSWYWDFKDGIRTNMQDPIHHFYDTGTFEVTLRVIKDSDTSYYSQKITATKRAAVRDKINPFAGKARSGAVSFVIDTLAYVGLGRDADSCFADMWQFNPLTDTWTDVAPFPGKARSGAVAFVLNTEVYVGLGGNQVSSTLYNDFYSYNPKENTWKQVADFGGTARSNAVAFAIGDTAYVGTGTDSSGATKDFWKYTAGTNQWTEITDFTGDARSGAVGFEIDGKGYISGGQDFGFQLSDVQEYNPETGKWKEKVFADANLTFNRATTIGVGKTAFICYGDKKKVVSYTPHTNKIEDLGDVLNLEDVRQDAVSFFLYGAAYFGLGVTYGDFSDNYAAHYKNDIQHIDLPFVFGPEDILLSNDTLAENSEYGTVIGTFSTVDKTEVDSFTYEITEGFNLFIEKDELKDMGSNYEIDSVYFITVKTTDSEGFTFEKAFTIKVKDINEAPWKLEIVGDTVLSGAPIGTPVGKFKAYDEDTNDTHMFKFDATRSDSDTTFYNIIGDSLLVAGTINKDDLMHDFYVLAIDKGGLELSQQIFIDIIEGVGIRMVESAVNLFDIYPNPVGDVLTIQSKNRELSITELVLVNAMGKVVSKTENVNATNHSLRTASMKPGIYFLMVRTEQGTYMQKLVKE